MRPATDKPHKSKRGKFEKEKKAMKKFSKILSVALLVALVLSLGITNAFAASLTINHSNNEGDS